ncbi:hypothetical protein Cflav_PD1790 [Pedosphaera parvula Ellin514]|uniref:Uncharacterized protein n=1 Tax=Pedosphaera parvula (strain Ellin514) TaxID=320771 RepID=B9XN32_PEDPL|nr:hypothetical protein Cflav_PD1790 [Pedosphaera parvula Ellin514]
MTVVVVGVLVKGLKPLWAGITGGKTVWKPGIQEVPGKIGVMGEIQTVSLRGFPLIPLSLPLPLITDLTDEAVGNEH